MTRAIIERLRREIAALEGTAPLDPAAGQAGLAIGVPEIDAHLPWNGLAPAALHEIFDAARPAASDPVGGPATAFAALLAARAQAAHGGPIVWIAPHRGQRRSLHGDGLAAWGLDPWGDALMCVHAHRATDALWAAEETLHADVAALVCVEIDAVDLAAGRRLKLAAETGAAAVLLLRRGPPIGGSGGVTRWVVRAAASAPATPMPTPGAPRWRLELAHVRGGRPAAWLVEWTHDLIDRPDQKPTHRLRLVPDAGDRPACLADETTGDGRRAA